MSRSTPETGPVTEQIKSELRALMAEHAIDRAELARRLNVGPSAVSVICDAGQPTTLGDLGAAFRACGYWLTCSVVPATVR